MLEPLADRVWVRSVPHAFLGLQLGTRMTVVRLPDGGLWVHSPVALTPELKETLDALGPVRHVVCPNLYHHVYAGAYAVTYPGALVHAPAGLARKRRDLRIDAALSELPHPGWGEALRPLALRGSLLHETVFLHPASRTLISADLLENFDTSGHGPTRLYLKLSRVHGRPGVPPLVKVTFWNRAAARESLRRLLVWDFERLVLAHGRVVEQDAKETLRRAYAWL
jgi:hypothetical protein